MGGHWTSKCLGFLIGGMLGWGYGPTLTPKRRKSRSKPWERSPAADSDPVKEPGKKEKGAGKKGTGEKEAKEPKKEAKSSKPKEEGKGGKTGGDAGDDAA